MSSRKLSHDRYFQFWRNLINAQLQERVPDTGGSTELVRSAMNYAVSQGHRWRPLILVTAYEQLTGKSGVDVIDAACAVELIHSCTIIVDDLPCVDGAALRRSKPTCHKIYGEAATLYASHLLYGKAERLAYENALKLGIDAEPIWYYISDLRERLVEAQVQELNLNEGRERADWNSLERLYELKSYPFIVAGWLGATLGQIEPRWREAVIDYSRYLGMAYQVIDDVQDFEGDPSQMGKATGMDQGRVNLVRWAGVSNAKLAATKYLHQAEMALNVISSDTSILRDLMNQAVGISRLSERLHTQGTKCLAQAS